MVDGHLQGVEGEVDIGAVFVAPRGEVALHHQHRVLGEGAGELAGAFPVAVGDLGDHLAAFLQRLQHQRQVKVPAEGAAHADLNVVKVDKDSNFEFFFVHECRGPVTGGVPGKTESELLFGPDRSGNRVMRRAK